MNPFLIAALIIIGVLLIAIIVLSILGKRAEKKKAAQDEQIAAAAQTVSMLVIDKKRMPIKDSGLPQQVIDQTPKIMRRSKLPIVKAKIGPRILTLIADEKIYDEIPIKKEVKASVSGLYITSVRGLRGALEKPAEKKKGIRAKLRAKYDSLTQEANAAREAEASAKAKKKKRR